MNTDNHETEEKILTTENCHNGNFRDAYDANGTYIYIYIIFEPTSTYSNK